MTNIISRISTIEKIITPEKKKNTSKELLALEAERKFKLIGLELEKYITVKRKKWKIL